MNSGHLNDLLAKKLFSDNTHMILHLRLKVYLYLPHQTVVTQSDVDPTVTIKRQFSVDADDLTLTDNVSLVSNAEV